MLGLMLAKKAGSLRTGIQRVSWFPDAEGMIMLIIPHLSLLSRNFLACASHVSPMSSTMGFMGA